MLVVLDETDEMVVYGDPSDKGLSYVLMQHGLVIVYVSQHLRSHEKNYPTHNWDLATVIFCIKEWRLYRP